MSKTTLDLSTLSDITDGTHTVKVKAKASGYNDSEFSNEVSYTKAPEAYSGEFTTYTAGSPKRPYTTVTVTYNGESYKLTPTAAYEVLTKQLNIKAGETFSWEINNNESISVISNKNCIVISSSRTWGSAKPTGSDWQLSTSF